MVKSTGVEIRFSMVAGEDHSDCRGARENAILDAAIELIAEVGYERVTVDAIAARAHDSRRGCIGACPAATSATCSPNE